MKKIIILALASLLLGGCAHSAKYHIASGDMQTIQSLDGIYLDVAPLENGPLTVEIHPEPWRYQSIANAQYQYYTPPSSPNVSPGQAAAAGAVGGLIGTLIASKMAKDQAQNAAQQPAQPLIDGLAGRALQRDVREAVVDGLLSSEFAAARSLRYGPITDEKAPRLLLQPSIKLTNGLDVLKFNINAELFAGGKQPLYRNSVEYWSAGTGYVDKQGNLAYWLAGDLEAFYGELNLAMAHTSDYLAQSLGGTLPREDEKQATHKIAASGGWVMLRGNVIQETDQFTVLKDLRGNIKIIRGTLMQRSSAASGSRQ
ncbi:MULTISPECIES: hypothetical protein [unclassified Microbulbifer]|uniref:hypothetical protein n=1 Tax=unclassified Microbulbifer TaxID=2619833 RepID=UPI0027E59198|nr:MULTISPECIES: hypothetical protein [unclassified Microbulbifer]